MRRNYFSLLGQRRNTKVRSVDEFITERAMHDEKILLTVNFLEEEGLVERGMKPGPHHRRVRDLAGLREMTATDGVYYRDTRLPFIVADAAAVTLTATALGTPLLTAGFNFGFLPANYFGYPGKLIKMTQFGKMTTAATPGNLTASYSVSNADNTRLTSSAAAALILNKTGFSWWSFGYCRCRTTGPTGTAFVWGQFIPHVGLVASTAQPILIPDSLAVTTTFDSTATQGFNLQIARSGSTLETITTQELTLEALN